MTDENAVEQPKIIPERYREILQGLELRNIILINSSSKMFREEASASASISLNEKASFSKKGDQNIEIIQSYHLVAKNETSKKKYLDILYETAILYSSKEDFSEEFFDVFKHSSLPLNTWPFFREFVYNITSRMFIPPLTLPLIKR